MGQKPANGHRGGDESHRSGHKGGRAQPAGTIQAGASGGVRGRLAQGRGPIRGRVAGQFRGINGGNPETLPDFAGKMVFLPEDLPRSGEEGVVAGFGQVTNDDQFGQGFASPSAGGDHRDARVPAGRQKVGFVGHAINGINHQIGGKAEQVGRIGGAVVGEARFRPKVRVDAPAALGEDFRLGQPNRSGQGRELPVDVALANIIQVDQIDGPQAAAGQPFDHPGANPAQADDHDPAPAEDFQLTSSQQSRDTVEGWVLHSVKIALVPSFWQGDFEEIASFSVFSFPFARSRFQ